MDGLFDTVVYQRQYIVMETKTPSVSKYTDQRIPRLMERIEKTKERLVLLKLVEYTDEIMWKMIGIEARLKKSEELLKKLLNDEQDRKLLAAEMTLLFEKIVDKSNASGYGDNFEDHY